MSWNQRRNSDPGRASCPESIPGESHVLEKILQMMLPLTLIAMALFAILLPWDVSI